MEASLLNSLVGDYLSSLGSKLAEKFKKETKATPLPPGSPGLKEMVKHFQESPTKRKLEITNGASPAKKAKKVNILSFFHVVSQTHKRMTLPRGREGVLLHGRGWRG